MIWFYTKKYYQKITYRKQLVSMNGTDTLPGIGVVVVVVTAKYKY